MQQRSADITTYKLVLSSKLVLSTVLKPAKYQLNAVASCAADWAELAAAGRPSAKRSYGLLRFPYSMVWPRFSTVYCFSMRKETE